jgi:hypothetical protein
LSFGEGVVIFAAAFVLELLLQTDLNQNAKYKDQIENENGIRIRVIW